MIRIEKRGKRIEVHSREPLAGMKTTIPGAYLTSSGYWTVPLSIESCMLLREKFGQRLSIGNELRRWASGVVENRKAMAELAAQEDAKLHVLPKVAPKLYKAMASRKYQRVGARFIADNSATLVADDPGLGKTLIALGGILEGEVEGPYLIVAPKTASDSVWRREIQRWLPEDHRAVIMPEYGYQRSRRLRLTRYGPKTWVIVHPEMLMVQAWWVCQQEITKRKRQRHKRTGKVRFKEYTEVCGKRTVDTGKRNQRELSCGHIKTRKTQKLRRPRFPTLFNIEWGAVVIDESHEMLIKRTGALTQRRRGADTLKIRVDGKRIPMSGTPFDSKPHQLWGTLNWMYPDVYSAFHRWSELYWTKGGFTGYQIGEFRKDREKMLWDSLSSVALRRTKAEVAEDLPPKTYVGTPLDPFDDQSPIGVWLEMEGRQEQAYRDMERLSVAELDSGRLEAITALAELTRLKQLACAYGRVRKQINRDGELELKYDPQLPSNKFNWTAENLEEWGFPDNPITKVVIVSFYTGILDVFAAGLEKHFKTGKRPMCTAITGKTPTKARRGIIDRFNNSDDETVMMLNVKAGGTAITIDTADKMVFISETRIPDQQNQAEDRIHRVSNPRKVMYYYLRSLGTVDVGTAITNQEMDEDTHRLLDGRRGVEYMRHIMKLSH